MPLTKRETVLSYLSGGLFSLAWWLWIDAHAYNVHINDPVTVKGQQYAPGIISTFGLILVNIVNWNTLNNPIFIDETASKRAFLFLMFAFVISFAGIVIAIWLAVSEWFQANPSTIYPGIMLIVQNILIFASSIIYRFAKPHEEEF